MKIKKVENKVLLSDILVAASQPVRDQGPWLQLVKIGQEVCQNQTLLEHTLIGKVPPFLVVSVVSWLALQQ